MMQVLRLFREIPVPHPTFCCLGNPGALRLYTNEPLSVADLAEAPRGPWTPLFWVKKQSHKEEMLAGQAKQPPTPLIAQGVDQSLFLGRKLGISSEMNVYI